MQTKPGFTTSEFWGKLAVQLLALLVLLGVLDIDAEGMDQIAIVVAGVVESAYAISRGWTKAHVPPK